MIRNPEVYQKKCTKYGIYFSVTNEWYLKLLEGRYYPVQEFEGHLRLQV